MPEYIDREAFIENERRIYCAACERRMGVRNGKAGMIYEIGDAPCRSCGIDDMLGELEDFPASEVAEVKHARWVDDEGKFVKLDDDGIPAKEAWCSVCNDWLTASDEYPTRGYYCPNCGAKMDESED